VNTSGEVTLVWWDSPAFDAGLSVGTKIVALNDRTFKTADLKAALVSGKSPLRLLVQKDDVFRTVEITYDGGLRYPHLEKMATARPGSTTSSHRWIDGPESRQGTCAAMAAGRAARDRIRMLR